MCLNLQLAVLTVFENQHRLYKQISKMSLKLITRSYVSIIIASCNQINCNIMLVNTMSWPISS